MNMNMRAIKWQNDKIIMIWWWYDDNKMMIWWQYDDDMRRVLSHDGELPPSWWEDLILRAGEPFWERDWLPLWICIFPPSVFVFCIFANFVFVSSDFWICIWATGCHRDIFLYLLLLQFWKALLISFHVVFLKKIFHGSCKASEYGKKLYCPSWPLFWCTVIS